jgi:opacity protein-like surface antigen
MQKNTPINYAALLTTLLFSTSSILPAVAQESSQPKLSPEVSNLLNKLMSKKPKASAPTPVKDAATSDADAALTPDEFAKSQQSPVPVKSKPRPTMIAPKPVEIGSEMPLDKAVQPKAKRSLPDFVHNIYIRADYGAGMPVQLGRTHFQRSQMYGGGIGYKFNQALRADINFQRRKLGVKRRADRIPGINDIQHSVIFLNAYLDLMDEDSYVTPYLTAGLGHSENKAKGFTFSFNDGVNSFTANSRGGSSRDLAWNAGAGVALRLTKNLSLEANYKFVDIGKVRSYSTITLNGASTSGDVNKRQHIHEVAGGLVIKF